MFVNAGAESSPPCRCAGETIVAVPETAEMPLPVLSADGQTAANGDGPSSIFLRRGRYTRAGPSISQDSDKFANPFFVDG